jgi:TPR repeat protein
MYAAGQGVPVDQDEAERHWRIAAAAGNTQALHDLGTLFTHHRGDLTEGARWYLEATRHGIVAAAAELRLLATKLHGPARFNPRARTMLGVIHAFHLDDPAAAVRLLTIPAQHGDPVAQRTLAYLIQHGQGTDPDHDRAIEFYRAAAHAGDGIAAFNLAMLSDDIDEALRWLRQAADAQVTEAYRRLGDKLSQNDLDGEALHWYLRGAEAGDTASMSAAACLYRDGHGGPIDLIQALRWYLAMLQAGNGDGIHQAHKIVPRMTDDQIHEAGRLSGHLLEAHMFVLQRST